MDAVTNHTHTDRQTEKEKEKHIAKVFNKEAKGGYSFYYRTRLPVSGRIDQRVFKSNLSTRIYRQELRVSHPFFIFSNVLFGFLFLVDCVVFFMYLNWISSSLYYYYYYLFT